MSGQATEAAQRDLHPSMYDMEHEDFVTLVRYHGANEVIDAVLAVAVSIYGDVETAVERCHQTFLLRAAAMSVPPALPPCDPTCGPDEHVAGCHQERFTTPTGAPA